MHTQVKRFQSYAFTIYFILSIVFSVVLYSLFDLRLGFSYFDEILLVFLTIVWLATGKGIVDVIYVFFVFIFYLLYSLWINSNSQEAILVDLLIQLKPFLTFILCIKIAPYLSKFSIYFIKVTCIICYIYLLVMGLVYVVEGFDLFFLALNFGGNGSGYSSAVSIVSLVYFYFSDRSTSNKVLFIILLIPGLIVFKSRFYGFLVASIFLIFWGDKIKLRLSLRNAVLLLLVSAVSIFVAWSKIDHYFTSESQARYVLYFYFLILLKDFFPFGTGFATYGTHASRLYYSDIYDQYSISNIWGLSREFDAYIADTFFPTLAQFGICGIFLFVRYFRGIFKLFQENNKRAVLAGHNNNNSVFLICISYLFIECIANAILTSSLGVFIMAFLGIIIGRCYNLKKN